MRNMYYAVFRIFSERHDVACSKEGNLSQILKDVEQTNLHKRRVLFSFLFICARKILILMQNKIVKSVRNKREGQSLLKEDDACVKII